MRSSKPLPNAALALVGLLGCQPTFWHLYGGPGVDESSSVVELSDGGFAVAGMTYTTGPAQMQVLRTDRLGGLEWSRAYGADAGAAGIVSLDGGDLVIAGTSGFYSQQGSVATLMRLDSSGGLVWQRDLPDDPGYSRRISSVRVREDGSFVLAGSRRLGDVGDSEGLLVKADASGEEEWAQTVGGSGYQEALDLAPVLDGGYVLVGLTAVNFQYEGAWVVKTDSSGEVEWQRAFGSTDQAARAVASLENGDIVVAGGIAGADGYLGDAYLFRIDGDGNLLWQRQYGDEALEEGAAGLALSSDRVVIAGGRGHLPDDVLFDPFLVASDLKGNELWRRTLASPLDDSIAAIRPTQDGGYVLAGRATLSSTNLQAVLIKTDSEGRTVPPL